MPGEVVFEAKNMKKVFGPIVALKGVDIELRRGEIRGLVGENGSGKSTIMSIASGMQPATSGEMFYKGKPWKPSSMLESQRAGISMILQESNTIGGASVAENLFAGRENLFAKFGILLRKKMNKAANEMLDKFGISHIRGEMPINSLTFEDRKLVEIVRCVTDETEILVVDETTTALSLEGRQILYKLVHKMCDEGKSIVFVSHDMDEIMKQCRCLTVLRDGEIIGHLTREEMDEPHAIKKIRQMMVGRDIGDAYYREDYDISHGDKVALEISHVDIGKIKDFSLTLHEGEIVGFGGLSGCGMHEIGKAAFGLVKVKNGTVSRGGKIIKSPKAAIKNGIGYISKNRDSEALMLGAPIGDNIVLPSLSDLNRFCFVNPVAEKRLAKSGMDALNVKAKGPKQYVNTLSGGNKQKVSFAKWMAKGCDVIIMDCPTRGVDIAVKQAMYATIAEMKKQGKAIIMISEEMAELIGMVDKLIVMKDFAVTKEFTRSPDLKESDIIEYMI